MLKEIYYRVLCFESFTDDHRKKVLGICSKMGAMVDLLSNGDFIIVTEDKEVLYYVDYLAECDLVQVLE